MMLDVRNLCSDEQSLISAVGTVKSTRSMPRGGPSTDQFGNVLTGDAGKSHVPIFCQMVQDLDSAGGAATIQAQLVQADDEDLGVNVKVVQETAAIAEAVAIAGYNFQLGPSLPPGVSQAFWGFRYVIAGEAVTQGKASAGVAAARQTAPGM